MSGRPQQDACPHCGRSISVILLVSLLIYVVLGACLLGLAGRWKLPWLWSALVTLALSHLVMIWVVFRDDLDLARERLWPGPGEPLWDNLILKLVTLLMFTNLAIGPLDIGRFHWSDSIPIPLRCAGLLGIVTGMTVMTWAMAANTYFSKVVRIQTERGHAVIQSGPYRLVRHPGYVGWILLWTSFSLSIGSWLAVWMSLPVAAMVVLRTALEDRFLQKHLDGYDEYARRVKWRLVPRVW